MAGCRPVPVLESQAADGDDRSVRAVAEREHQPVSPRSREPETSPLGRAMGDANRNVDAERATAAIADAPREPTPVGVRSRETERDGGTRVAPRPARQSEREDAPGAPFRRRNGVLARRELLGVETKGVEFAPEPGIRVGDPGAVDDRQCSAQERCSEHHRQDDPDHSPLRAVPSTPRPLVARESSVSSFASTRSAVASAAAARRSMSRFTWRTLPT